MLFPFGSCCVTTLDRKSLCRLWPEFVPLLAILVSGSRSICGPQLPHLWWLQRKSFLAALSVVLRPATSESSESLLGINNLRTSLTLSNLKSAALQDSQMTDWYVLIEVWEAQTLLDDLQGCFFSPSFKIAENTWNILASESQWKNEVKTALLTGHSKMTQESLIKKNQCLGLLPQTNSRDRGWYFFPCPRWFTWADWEPLRYIHYLNFYFFRYHLHWLPSECEELQTVIYLNPPKDILGRVTYPGVRR